MTAKEPRDEGTSVDVGAIVGADPRSRVERDAPLATAPLVGADGLAQLRHEVRTLLSSIIGISGVLLETDLSPEQREYARCIRSSGDTVLSLLNDIMDVGHVGAGVIHIEDVNFDLRRAVEEAGELLVERARDDGTELVVDIRPDVPGAVRGDAARLRQVLLNLAGHAIRAVPRGEVLLRASLAPDADDGARPGHRRVRVRFDVRCAARLRQGAALHAGGAGPAERDAGSRAAAGLRSPLGVAIASRLIAAMGGEISAAGDDARGHLLSFLLSFERRTPSYDRVSIPRVDLAGKRALVVDDSAAVRRAVQAMIEELGMACSSSASGPAALSALHAAAELGEPFNVVLLDEDLEELGGSALVSRIRSDATTARTQIILMAHLGSELPSGMLVDAQLTKPIRRAQLHASLRGLVAPTPERVASGIRAAAKIRRRITPHPETLRAARTKILVVEDNAVNQKVAAFMLEKRGCTVEVVASGQAAVDAVGRTRYAAVLMDCQMPIVDGYAATAEIRRIEGAQRRTPIIAMTAHVGPGAREKCLASGMDDYLSKPLMPEELERVLRTWCVPARAAANEASPRDSDPQGTDPPPASVRGAPPPSGRGATPAPPPPRSLPRVEEPDVVLEVIELFLTEAPTRIDEMRQAVTRGALGELEQIAWALRDRAGELAAANLRELCERLAREARAGTQQSAAEAIERVAREVARVQETLAADRRRRGLG